MFQIKEGLWLNAAIQNAMANGSMKSVWKYKAQPLLTGTVVCYVENRIVTFIAPVNVIQTRIVLWYNVEESRIAIVMYFIIQVVYLNLQKRELKVKTITSYPDI